MLASSCVMKLPTRHYATLANTVNSCVSNWLACANAHAVLASACVLKLPTRHYATLANTMNSCVSN